MLKADANNWVDSNTRVENKIKIDWKNFALTLLLDVKNMEDYLQSILEMLQEIEKNHSNWIYTQVSKKKIWLIRKQVWLMWSLLFHSGDNKNKLLNSIKDKLEKFPK